MKSMKDLRLNEDIFKTMIGQEFFKYTCDPFDFTNTVTGIVGLYIGGKVFEIKNEQIAFQYFDSLDDIALWNIKQVNDSDIHSFFENTEQTDTPVNQMINSITLVNEHQIVNIHDNEYSLWITRAIIFRLQNIDIYFEKDSTAFSEEIEIKRGHNLLSDFPKRNDYFLDQWIKCIGAKVETEFIKIQSDKQKTAL